jgi:hypothetical protein
VLVPPDRDHCDLGSRFGRDDDGVCPRHGSTMSEPLQDRAELLQ